MSTGLQSPMLRLFSNPWIGFIGAGAGVIGILVAIILYFAGKKTHGALKFDRVTWLFAFVLGLAALAVVVLQIESLNTQSTNTTEAALFSILQFVLTIGFAWVLSRASFRREFAEGQKAFATAAYRRTREIEVATNRLIARTSSPKPDGSADLNHELEVISAIARGIQQAVSFSVADWADVIGEEIAALEKIEELTKEEKALQKSPTQDEDASGVSKPSESAEISNRLLGVEQQIERLRASLPPGLRALARKGPPEEELMLRECEQQFTKELKETDRIQLSGFWEEGEGFGRSVKEFTEGTELRVEINDAGSRTSALMLTDGSGVPIGVIINSALFKAKDYDMFTEALCRVLGRSRFPVKVVQIDPNPTGGRIYFKVETMPNAVHPRRMQELSIGKHS